MRRGFPLAANFGGILSGGCAALHSPATFWSPLRGCNHGLFLPGLPSRYTLYRDLYLCENSERSGTRGLTMQWKSGQVNRSAAPKRPAAARLGNGSQGSPALHYAYKIKPSAISARITTPSSHQYHLTPIFLCGRWPNSLATNSS